MSHTIPTASETKRGAGTRKPPGPRSFSPLGSAPAIARDTQAFALDMWQHYGDIVRFRLLFWPAYALFHPDHLKYVLQDNHRNYDKHFPMMNTVRPLFGNGLFTNDGASWLHQRRLMQPSFHHKRLAGFATLMTGATLAMLERWQGGDSQHLDIPLEMMRLTQRIVGLALFNLDLSNEVDTVGRTFTTLLPLLSTYTFVPFPPLWVPTPRNRRLQAGLETLNTVVYSIITERRKQATEPGMDTGDLLSMLLAARDEETGEGMSDQQVRDEVMTLLLAGHETTALALTWTWYLLSEQAILLVNAATETRWFQRLYDYPICFVKGRIQFWSLDEHKNGPTVGSAFVYFGANIERFITVFSRFGVLVVRLCMRSGTQGVPDLMHNLTTLTTLDGCVFRRRRF